MLRRGLEEAGHFSRGPAPLLRGRARSRRVELRDDVAADQAAADRVSDCLAQQFMDILVDAPDCLGGTALLARLVFPTSFRPGGRTQSDG